MKIRSIRTEDVPTLLDINQVNVPMVGALDIEMMDVLVENCDTALLVEAIEDTSSPKGQQAVQTATEVAIAGFCLVFGPGSPYESVNYRWFCEHVPSAYYLDRVAFCGWAQGHGFGSGLYRHLFAMLVDRGVTQLGLEVNIEPPNLPSLRFHERHGFQEVGRQKTPYGTTVSLLLKDLA